MKPFCFLESCLPFYQHQHSFQKGDNILTLITFTMSLIWYRENHHFSLLSLSPITFNFNTISCYGGSYYETIGVVLYYPTTSEFVRPSIPMSHRHFLQASLPLFKVCSPSKVSSAIIKLPQSTTVIYINIQLQLLSSIFELHNTSMGKAYLVCIQILFFHLEKGFGPKVEPLPPKDHS
jgi:hypothetical protein